MIQIRIQENLESRCKGPEARATEKNRWNSTKEIGHMYKKKFLQANFIYIYLILFIDVESINNKS